MGSPPGGALRSPPPPHARCTPLAVSEAAFIEAAPSPLKLDRADGTSALKEVCISIIGPTEERPKPRLARRSSRPACRPKTEGRTARGPSRLPAPKPPFGPRVRAEARQPAASPSRAAFTPRPSAATRPTEPCSFATRASTPLLALTITLRRAERAPRGTRAAAAHLRPRATRRPLPFVALGLPPKLGRRRVATPR